MDPTQSTTSLRTRIWYASGVLAGSAFVWAVLAYVLAVFVVSGIVVPLAVMLSLTGTSALIFGWWMANEVLIPVNKVGLLAKSIERNSAFALPRTTGSAETDEILQTFHRTAHQQQNLISLMEEVCSGRTAAALAPLQNADRLFVSFQKLVGKVTDSLDAKQELESLQSAAAQLSRQVTDKAPASARELGSPHLQRVSDVVKQISARCDLLAGEVRSRSAEIAALAAECRERMCAIVESDPARQSRFRSIWEASVEAASRIEKFGEEHARLLENASALGEDLDAGLRSAETGINSLRSARRKAGIAVQALARVEDQCGEFGRLSKSADELARRTKLITTNLEIGSADMNVSRPVKELQTLLARSESLRREVSSIGEVLAARVREAAAALAEVHSDTADAAMPLFQDQDLAKRLREHLARTAEALPGVRSLVNDLNDGSHKLRERIEDARRVAGNITQELQLCGQLQTKVLGAAENLRSAAVKDTSTLGHAAETEDKADPGSLIPEDQLVHA
jgi:hypothetical protein